MMTAEMPTLKEWKARKGRKRRLAGALLAFVVVYALLCAALKPYFAAPNDCGQPCPEGRGCSPLGFTFQALPARKIPGISEGIWYKAEITNRSCLELWRVHIDSFYSSDANLSYKGLGIWIKVFDHNGKEIPRSIRQTPDGGMAWDFGSAKGSQAFQKGTIHPYQNDRKYVGRLLAEGWKTEDGATTIMPGKSFGTVPSVVAPYRVVSTSVKLPDGGIADGTGLMDVENPAAYPAPPQGFRWLEGYSLHPGRYTVRSGFSSSFLASPIHPRWERMPNWLKFALEPARPRAIIEQPEVDLTASDVMIEVTK